MQAGGDDVVAKSTGSHCGGQAMPRSLPCQENEAVLELLSLSGDARPACFSRVLLVHADAFFVMSARTIRVSGCGPARWM